MSNEIHESPPDANARYAVPEAKRKSARRWFDQAKKLVEQRNYDYAIKSFVEGLALDPEAVADGFIPLRGCAVARWQTGGKKPGMKDSLKYSMTVKDPVKGMVNAAWLLAHDPTNPAYAEGLFKNANKAHCDDALMWIGPIYRELLGSEKKPAPKKFTHLKDIYEEAGDRFAARGEAAQALKAYEAGVDALLTQKNLDPKDRTLDNIIRDLTTKLTILRGNYQTADSFKDSVRDSDGQARRQDEDRLVQRADRLDELIEKARQDMEAHPEVEAKVVTYVDLLCKDESDAHEKAAITLLMERFKSMDNYRFKQRADDIAIRQLGRHARLARKAGDEDKAKELTRRRLGFELGVYRERVEAYPTDLRLKFEYGKRLFLARRFDDAIPMLQQARSEPKMRHACALHLGRCFFENGFYSQAIDVLGEAIEQYEMSDDELAKELNYWLGRSQQADGRTDDAGKTFGRLVQIDYNYRDVRDRMKELKGSGGAES